MLPDFVGLKSDKPVSWEGARHPLRCWMIACGTCRRDDCGRRLVRVWFGPNRMLRYCVGHFFDEQLDRTFGC